MPGDVPKLDQIQMWMQSVITHPEGVRAGVDSSEAHRQIAVSPETIEDVVTRSKSLSSLERLTIYGNAYYARLLECLRDEFPATAHAMGAESFDAYAMGYLQSYASASYTLGQLGASFPRFLSEIPIPPPAGQSEQFPSFLADLSALERTYSEIFDGPGLEGGLLMSPDDLKQVPPEAWPEVKLIPSPSLRLASFRFPVHEYVSSVRSGEQAEIPAPAETKLAINRREFVVRRVSLDRLPFALLSHLVSGKPLGEAISEACQNTDADLDELAGALQSWFQDWANWQFFARLETPRS